MAKLKGPLFSIDAKGKLGNSLVFSSNKNIKRVSKHYKPHNPRTIIQQDNRSIFSYAILSWQSLDEGQKEDYNQSASNLELGMSGYNYYIQTYLTAYGGPPLPVFPITNGLVARWRLDEPAGPTAYDWWNGHNGTIYGAVPTTGIIDGAFLFDGIDDYIEVPNHSDFNLGPGASFSIFAWVRSSDIAKTQYIVDKYYDGSARMWQMRISGSNIFVQIANDDGSGAPNYQGDTVLTPYQDQWIWIGFKFDNNANLVTVYLNGSADMTPVAKNDNCWSNSETINIGKYGFGDDNFFPGKLDDITIWNRALSDAEILELYNFYTT